MRGCTLLSRNALYYPCDWGRFMAYMPIESAVLFPRPEGDQSGNNRTRSGQAESTRSTTCKP